MRLRQFFLTSLLLMLLWLSPSKPVQACSGGGAPWNDWFPRRVAETPIIVLGSYVDLDDADANGVFRVELYFKGSGAEHLIIRQSGVEYMENRESANRYIQSCGRDPISNLSTSGSYIYFLERNLDGTYRNDGDYYFPDDYATIEVYGRFPLTKANFSFEIAARLGQPVSPPNADAILPRITPILISTEDGKHYLLPVDTNTPVEVVGNMLFDLNTFHTECSSPPCAASSLTGLDTVFLMTDDAERERFIQARRIQDTRVKQEHFLTGDRVAFSPTNDTFALWRNGSIAIFTLWYPAIGNPSNQYDRGASALLTEISAGDSLNYPIAWNPDGQRLAFSTREGLWLWEALITDDQPQLLIPAQPDSGIVPTVREFSLGGRYIAITAGERRYNLDLISERELPDGMISPDERKMLILDTSATEPVPMRLAYIAPGWREADYAPGLRFAHVQWQDNLTFTAMVRHDSYIRETADLTACYEDEFESYCNIARELITEPYYEVKEALHLSGVSMFDFTFDDQGRPILHKYFQQDEYPTESSMQDRFTTAPRLGILAISMDDQSVNGIDLGLPSPIATAEWLRSPFYFSHP